MKITVCDKCGDTDEKSNYGWATVRFKSVQYLYDDGTVDQVYEWNICRSCKLDVIDFMETKIKRRK